MEFLVSRVLMDEARHQMLTLAARTPEELELRQVFEDLARAFERAARARPVLRVVAER